MQAMFRGLPDNFDPEEYEVAEGKPLSQFLGDDEGVTVLGVRVAKRQKKSADSPDGGTGDAGTGDAGAGEIRCWDCYKQPDGSWDCIRVPCPPGWPPPTHVKEA